mmetsp:Transcript_3473/g.6904  ORF Transcript_3473/g.6904 Transcript_3473/m.6904 type:complete len:166 (-) Transcript_3473:10-507(-)
MDDFDLGLLDDTTYIKTVLRQKMLGMFPVFMYRTKEKQPGEEYLADEWNLRKPLQECSIRVERRGEILLVVFTYKKEGSPPALFAVCKVDPVGTGESLEHWIQPVGDSSRFFAIRVTDEKGGREAVIGLGFREREEAEDFSQCITNYQNALTRERMERANEMVHQ